MYFNEIGAPLRYKGHLISYGPFCSNGFFRGYVYIVDGDLSRRYTTKKDALSAARCLPVPGPAVTVTAPELF